MAAVMNVQPGGAQGLDNQARWRWIGLAGLLVVSGSAHFLRPKFFDEIVPASLPGGQRVWTLGSGGAELATALAVAIPITRRHGSLLAGLLFMAVWPANFKMAFDWHDRPLLQRSLAWGRLPLQLPLVYWAWRVRRSTVHSPSVARGDG